MVTAGSGAKIEVWSASGREIATIKDSGNTIVGAALVPGGSLVLGTSPLGGTRVVLTFGASPLHS